MTPARVVGLFVLLWLIVAVVLALTQVSKPFLLAYAGATLVYAFFIAMWAMLRTMARMRGVVDEDDGLDGNQLLESLPAGAFIVDKKGRVRGVNNLWLDMFGLPHTQVWRKKYKTFCDPVMRGHLDRVMDSRQSAYALALSAKLPNGRNIRFLADAIPFGGGLLVMTRIYSPELSTTIPYLDVDRHYQLGKAAEHLLPLVHERLIGLQERLPSDDAESWAAQEITQLGALVGQWSAMAQGAKQPPSAIDASRLVREVVELVEPYAAQAKLSLQVDLAETAPPVTGRAAQLQHALLALLLNAFDTAPAGSDVSVSLRPSAEGIELAVTDHGASLPDKVKERLFSPLVSAAAEGLGLGLALARQIAREHGGDLTYAEVEPTGNRFALRLPKESAVKN